MSKGLFVKTTTGEQRVDIDATTVNKSFPFINASFSDNNLTFTKSDGNSLNVPIEIPDPAPSVDLTPYISSDNSLTNNHIIFGNNDKKVKDSGYIITTTLNTSETSVPTSKAIRDFYDDKLYTSVFTQGESGASENKVRISFYENLTIEQFNAIEPKDNNTIYQVNGIGIFKGNKILSSYSKYGVDLDDSGIYLIPLVE